jgi:RNA polymerase sigma factor (sigma-70 family)
VEQLRAGDSAALCLLRRQIQGHLHSYFIRRFNCCDEDAEELVAEVLVRVHQSVERYDPDGGAKITTWIWRIAHNLGVDFARKQKQLASKDLSHVSLDEARERNFERQYAKDWFRDSRSMGLGDTEICDNEVPRNIKRIRRALAAISETDRNLIIMRLSMEYDEIAQTEGATEGAIRTRHSRAIERLRTAYEEEVLP